MLFKKRAKNITNLRCTQLLFVGVSAIEIAQFTSQESSWQQNNPYNPTENSRYNYLYFYLACLSTEETHPYLSSESLCRQQRWITDEEKTKTIPWICVKTTKSWQAEVVFSVWSQWVRSKRQPGKNKQTTRHASILHKNELKKSAFWWEGLVHCPLHVLQLSS